MVNLKFNLDFTNTEVFRYYLFHAVSSVETLVTKVYIMCYLYHLKHFEGPADYSVSATYSGPSYSFGVKLPPAPNIQRSKLINLLLWNDPTPAVLNNLMLLFVTSLGCKSVDRSTFCMKRGSASALHSKNVRTVNTFTTLWSYKKKNSILIITFFSYDHGNTNFIIFLFNSPVHFIVGPRVIMNDKFYWVMQLLKENTWCTVNQSE